MEIVILEPYIFLFHHCCTGSVFPRARHPGGRSSSSYAPPPVCLTVRCSAMFFQTLIKRNFNKYSNFESSLINENLHDKQTSWLEQERLNAPKHPTKIRPQEKPQGEK